MESKESDFFLKQNGNKSDPQEKEQCLPEVECHIKKTNSVIKLADSSEGVAPQDKFNLVYFIMIIHGIGTLISWNMFITATAYFVDYKLGGADDTYRKYFLSALGFVAQIPNVLLNLINVFFQCGGSGNLAIRITSSIIIIILMFIITVILAMVDSTTWPATFFWITMITVVIMNMANGIYQNSIYGTAAFLPMKYTNAVVLGASICGTISAVLNTVSIALAPDPQTAGIYYFIAAICVLILAFDSYLILPFSAFYRHYRDKVTAGHTVDSKTTTQPPFTKIIKKCFVPYVSLWFAFFVTLTCFPAIQAGIQPSSGSFPINKKYFTPVVCFLFFNIFGMLGSFAAGYIKVPGPRWVWLPVSLRGLFIPFFMFCNFNPMSRSLPILITNDYVYAIAGIVLAFTSAYFCSLCMMYAPRCVEDKHKGTAGMMAAFFLIFGIFSGICFSFAVIAFIENVGNYVPSPVMQEFINATTPLYNVTVASFL